MRAINHALTGAAIGAIVSQPAIAIPAAFLSHFALDTVPHFGVDRQTDIAQKWFQRLLVFDVIACFSLVALVAAAHPKGWVLVVVSAFVAAMPDLILLPRFYRAKRYHNLSRKTEWKFVKFHDDLQTETPAGGIVELVWLPAMTFLLFELLK